MPPFLRFLGIAALLALLTASSSSAGTNADARLLLHLTAPTVNPACSGSQAGPPCADAVTAGDLAPNTYYAYLLIGNTDPIAGVAGVQFGIEYNGAPGAGVDVFTWRNCGSLQFNMPGWPASGTGTLIVWDRTNNCQRPGGNSVVAGYFYVTAYSPDQLRIVPRQTDGVVRVIDCQNVETVILGPGTTPAVYPLGRASFTRWGGTLGYNPCQSGGPMTCSIQGPEYATANGNTENYTLTVSDPLAAISWSIAGNGSLVGGTGNWIVQVAPGAAGSFELTAAVTGSGGFSTCTRTVTVTDGCNIAGPASVVAGQSADFTAYPNVTSSITCDWSITGSGTITSTFGNVAHVTAGDAGTFTLHVSFTSDTGLTGDCARTVAITQPFQCELYGPHTLLEGEMGTYSSTGPPSGGASYQWSVTGNGTLLSPPGLSWASVRAGAVGTLRVQAVVTTPTGVSTCAMDTQINPSGPQPGLNSNAKILIHLATPTGRNACTRAEAMPACRLVKTNGTLYPDSYFAYVLVCDGFTDGTAQSGIAGVQFGIRYDGADHSGVDIFGWTSCATLEFPMSGWPATGTGNLVTWDPASRCQRTEPGGLHTGVEATVGYFYLSAYSEDRLRITPRPADGYAKVASCESVETVVDSDAAPHVPSPLGDVYFSATGTRYGYNPCDAGVPVIPTTWSQIKTMYGRD